MAKVSLFCLACLFSFLHFFISLIKVIFIISYFYVFIYCGCARSSLLLGSFSSCSEQELLCTCWAQFSHCGGLSRCGAQALGHAGFSSCGVWAQ